MKDHTHSHCDALIIGAGPAGLMAAITAAQRAMQVLVLERMPRPGLKLLASGGGRCNITNKLPSQEFVAAFGRNGRFMVPALEQFSSTDLVSFFAQHNVPIVFPDHRGYPQSDTAQDIHRVLTNRCAELGVTIKTHSEATRLHINDDRIQSISTENGQTIACESVIITTGGCGYPALGGNRRSYRLAEQAGHAISTLSPANAPLVTGEAWTTILAGTAVQSVAITCNLKGAPKKGWMGDLLFTHKGISGPVVLDASRYISPLLHGGNAVPLKLNFINDRTSLPLSQLMNQWRALNGKRKIINLLGTLVPHSLAAMICSASEISPEIRGAMLPKSATEKICTFLSACPLTIRTTEGFDKAMVTHGGVSLKKVDPLTLRSKRIQNLFFAGEVLDLDGPCGGFNLQWAFSSGVLAGKYC